MTYQETAYQKFIPVDADGNIISIGGGRGSGGDASATNQTAQITLETEIRDRLPSVLVGDRLKTDGSGVTQPVSAASLPLPSGAATDVVLQQVRDAIKATLDIASTIWTDNSGAFYVRRDLVNEGTGTINVSFTDPSGSATTPGAGLRPLSTTDKDTITDFYDVLTSSTGYSVGDLLARVAVLDANSGSPSATFIWLNLSQGTILGSTPTSANIERANENVGARQIGNWVVAANLDATNTNYLSNLNTAIGTPITGAAMPTGGIGWLGWLSAIWKLISDRIPTLGTNNAANSTPVTLASDGVFAIFAGLASDAASVTGSIHAKLRAIASTIALDSSVQSIVTLLAKGQGMMSASIPVAIASNQSAIPVNITDGLVVSGSLAALGVLFTQDTTGYQSVAVQVTSAGSSSTIIYEHCNDNATWLPTYGYDLITGTGNSTTNSLVTRIFPIYTKYFRARVSVFGSGTVTTTAVFRLAPYQGYTNINTVTSPIAISGTIRLVPTNNNNGSTLVRVKSIASTNSTLIKSGQSNIFSWVLYNNSASLKFIKFYNKSTAPTVGTDIPVFTIGIPANSPVNFDSTIGLFFTTGLGYAITGGIADTDTTAVAVDDVTGFIYYA